MHGEGTLRHFTLPLTPMYSPLFIMFLDCVKCKSCGALLSARAPGIQTSNTLCSGSSVEGVEGVIRGLRW